MIVKRIDELIEKKHITNYKLKENTGISSTIYQWRKNTVRDATRYPSLRSIEKVCEFLDISLSYFFAFGEKEQMEYRIKALAEKLYTFDEEQFYAVEVMVNQINKFNHESTVSKVRDMPTE